MRKRLLIMAGILCFLSALILLEIYHSRHALRNSFYTVSSKELSSSLRVVQLSDVHDSTFGKDNCRLINLVKEACPDLILITGDLVNSHNNVDPDPERSVELVSRLVDIAPVYISYGNQELAMEEAYGLDFAELYSGAGATVLERKYKDIEIKGQRLRIGGIYGYCQNEAYAAEAHREEESDFLRDFQDTDAYKILLCHMPVSWILGGSLYDWNIDCVFAGHVHGGQVILPFVGGLWAPDMGWFPGRLSGIYATEEEKFEIYKAKILKWLNEMKASGKPVNVNISKYEDSDFLEYTPSYLVLSRGLGNTDWMPRFNNVPEVVVVDLVPEKD